MVCYMTITPPPIRQDLASAMVIAEWRWRRTGDGAYLELARRWAKGTGGAMYDVYAVQNASAPYGRAVQLAHLMVKGDRTIDAAVPVLQVASANHCSMH